MFNCIAKLNLFSVNNSSISLIRWVIMNFLLFSCNSLLRCVALKLGDISLYKPVEWNCYRFNSKFRSSLVLLNARRPVLHDDESLVRFVLPPHFTRKWGGGVNTPPLLLSWGMSSGAHFRLALF